MVHSDHCRKRAVETMKETISGRERLSAARKREDEFLACAVQQCDELVSERHRVEDPTMVTSAPVPAQVGGDGGANITGSTTVPLQQPLLQPRTSNTPSTSNTSMPSSSGSGILVQKTDAIASCSSTIIDDSVVGGQRSREVGDEGHQNMHVDKDVGMNMVCVS